MGISILALLCSVKKQSFKVQAPIVEQLAFFHRYPDSCIILNIIHCRCENLNTISELPETDIAI